MVTLSQFCTEQYFINKERVLYVSYYYQISMNVKPKMAVVPTNVLTLLGLTTANVAMVQR